MTLAPLLAAPLVTQIHAAAATTALASGTLVMAMPKGRGGHLALGRLFAVTMIVAAISSFWITDVWPGQFSPIHILSIVTLTTIPLAIRARRRGALRAHGRGMMLNYLGLLAAGAFTLSPGRIMNQVFASVWPIAGF